MWKKKRLERKNLPRKEGLEKKTQNVTVLFVRIRSEDPHPPATLRRRRRRRKGRSENGRVRQKTRLPRDAVAIDGKRRRRRRRRVFVFVFATRLSFFYRTSLLDLDAFCESAEEKKNVPRGREREREREREDASMNDERVPISLPRSRVPRARVVLSFFLSFFLSF